MMRTPGSLIFKRRGGCSRRGMTGDRAEAVIRLQRGLTAGLLQLVADALSRRGTELAADLGGYLPCRVLVVDSGGVEESWCALSGRAADGAHVRDRLRDVVFAALENRSLTRCSRSGAAGRRVRLAGGKWSGWACVSAGMPAGDALDVFGWDVEKVCGDGSVAAGEQQAGTLDALVDGVGVSRGVFFDGAVDDLGLGGVGERGEVADALFGFSADLDGCLVRRC